MIAFPHTYISYAYYAIKELSIMASGTVKWFNPTKGYGFIEPDEGGKDVFVHITAVQQAGLQGLQEGQKISYDLTEQRGRTSASNLKV